jgi:hypothetical protein
MKDDVRWKKQGAAVIMKREGSQKILREKGQGGSR